MEALGLYVKVPVASFRAPYAREYLETLPCPPPATAYGMLLSMVGEPNRLRHSGAELALALLGAPNLSVVLRTTWRVKSAKHSPGTETNRTPDFQELLTDLNLAIWIRRGQKEEAAPSLLERTRIAIASPNTIQRYGGLSLGESTCLVDEICDLRQSVDRVPPPPTVRWLVAERHGDLALPIWPDHVGSSGTRWGQFQLTVGAWSLEPPEEAWISVAPLW
jgi:CRISPR-associated protein Cas5t